MHINIRVIVYSDENALIPKNSSLIVVRVPLAGTSKKAWYVSHSCSLNYFIQQLCNYLFFIFSRDTGDHVGSKIVSISFL